MATKITLILDNPTDPGIFEAEYPALLERAAALFGQLGAMNASFTGLFLDVEEM